MSDETTLLPSHEDAIKELEADIWRSCEHLTTANNGEILVNVPWEKLREWFAIAATLGRKELERENSKLEHKMSNMETKLLKAQERIDELITAATLGSEREAKLIRAMEDVLRHATDTVWVSEIETLVDRMVSLGVYGCEVYEGARPWEVN